jgi:hypothetical protein
VIREICILGFFALLAWAGDIGNKDIQPVVSFCVERSVFE